jgi:hypothetical protein
MIKLIVISFIFIISNMAILLLSKDLENTDAEIEWCQKSLPFLPIEICVQRVWVLYH